MTLFSNIVARTLLPAALAVAFSTSTQGPSSAGQPKTAYKAMGAPAEPKVAVRWNRYHDYDRAAEILEQLAAAHPDRARLASAGKSHQGRDMWVLTITDFKSGSDTAKPAFWIDGGIHANEIQATEVALYTAWYLLEMHAQNAQVRRLLDRRAFYVAPMLSPDSRQAHFDRPNTTHSPRSGQMPIDDDRDGLVDEDGPDDLDGDGHITQMRIADPNGSYEPHPDYPNQMVRVEPGKRGQFTLLGSEGFDNDGDGRVNEDGDGRYDPNRNWPWNWQPESVQRGAHRYPLSLPENRAVADFILAHPNIAGAQSYHNTGGMILRGPGVKGDRYETADDRIFEALAAEGEKMLPHYRYVYLAGDLYGAHGVEFDWIYMMRGVFCFTNELFTPANFFHRTAQDGDDKDAKDGRRFFARDVEKAAFDKYLLLGEGVVPWREVDHPQWGRVEVGGFKKNWGRQPPSFLLEEECHRNMAFTLYHADQMPMVRIGEVRVVRLDRNLFQITAALENERLIPTRSAR